MDVLAQSLHIGLQVLGQKEDRGQPQETWSRLVQIKNTPCFLIRGWNNLSLSPKLT